MNNTDRQVAQLVQSTDCTHHILREQYRFSQHESLRHTSYQNSLLSSAENIGQRVVEMQAGFDDINAHLQPLSLDVSTISSRLSQLVSIW
jgi:hypothetical protein